MNFRSNKKQTTIIAIVVAIGVALAGLIFATTGTSGISGEHGHESGHSDNEHHGKESNDDHADDDAHGDKEHHENGAAPAKGPRGGKLFEQNGYGIEVTIFETGVEPQFRVYTYRDGKPLDPKSSQIGINVTRLGRAAQSFRLVPEGDYLKSDGVVEEPHSFKVAINAESAGKRYQFSYEQVEGRIEMTDEQVKQSGVEVLTAGPSRIREVLNLIGEVRFNQDRTVLMVPRLAGRVESVQANAGDTVRKGQVLAVISSQALGDQRAEAFAAQKRLALARATFEREKKLWEEKISAEQDYLQARALLQEAEIVAQNAQQKLTALGSQSSGGDYTRYELRAPVDGVIVDKKIALGEAVKEDATIFMISDLSTVWVEVNVYAKDLNTVKVGQTATVKATAFDSASNGKVSYVGSLVGEASRTATARIVLPNPKGIWRPGLPVNIELTAEEVQVPVVVAETALQSVGDGNVVFGRYDSSFEARPVEVGRRDGTWVEIVKGFTAGESYAAKNSFVIKAELGKTGASHDH